jgi:hypothetical protein
VLAKPNWILEAADTTAKPSWFPRSRDRRRAHRPRANVGFRGLFLANVSVWDYFPISELPVLIEVE